MFDKMKHINAPYYNNNNIEALTSKNIISIIVKIVKIIKLPQEEKLKNINKRRSKKKTKIISIIIINALMMEKKLNKK